MSQDGRPTHIGGAKVVGSADYVGGAPFPPGLAGVVPQGSGGYGGRAKPEPADPWAHRSEGMRCRSCLWFVQKDLAGPHPHDAVSTVGRCRRHAPSMNGYPVTYETDWCGDHRLDENKTAVTR